MNQPYSPLHSPGYISSSLSEVDSLSDSDWLDISSGRDSDLESVSDRGLHSSPPSRRSSISLGSSRDGEIEAWEGLVEDTTVEGPAITEQLHSVDVDAPQSDLTAEPAPHVEHDPDEDRVKEALDQSLIGTLSASRLSAHSSSAQSSIRDLRLSFPDPLTSSRDELNRSFETVKEEDIVEPAPEPDPLPTVEVEVQDETPTLSAAVEDSGSITTSGIPHHEATADLDDYNIEFVITLYGQSSANKWEFAQELVSKAIAPSGRIVTSTSQVADSPNRYVHFERQISQNASLVDTALIRDKTEQSIIQSDVPTMIGHYCRPSLAVVYLPSNIVNLPAHTFYLPVLASAPPGTPIDEWRKVAEAEWRMLSTSLGETLYLRRGAESPLIETIDEVDIGRARRAFHIISRVRRHRASPKSLTEHISSVNAVTLIAVTVSLIMGFAANASFRSSTLTPTPTVRQQPTEVLTLPPSANQTIAHHSTPISNDHMALSSSALKDFAVSVFSPATPPAVVTSPVTSLSITVSKTLKTESTVFSAATAKTSSCAGWEVSIREPLDVIVHSAPTSSLSVVQMESPSTISRAKPVSVPASILNTPAKEITSLGARIADTIQETVDVQMKAIVKSVQEDSQDLVDALDDLMETIRRQSKVIVEQSKDTAQILRERLQYRNDRARGRAKELRFKGERLVTKAAEELKDTLLARTERAKNRARKLTEEVVVASDAWYWKVHHEWMQMLNEGVMKTPEEPRRGKRPRDEAGSGLSRRKSCGTEAIALHCPFRVCELFI
ncbi:hypothetical protein AX16_002413 [Volvariella volvacea WC 439]|nr:hypothetical protein AX16_002413 [Volvariella volvacea WC 439]